MAKALHYPRISSRTYLIGSIALFAILLSPFLNTIFLAAIFALFFNPLLYIVMRRTGISKSRFLTLSFTLIMTLLIGVSVFGVNSIFDLTKANSDILMSINQFEIKLPAKISDEINKRFPEQTEQITRATKSALATVKDFLITATGKVFQSVPLFMMNFLVFLISLHFFLARSTSIRKRIIQMNAMAPKQLNNLFDAAHEAARETFISVLLIGLIQTTIVTLGALGVGINHLAAIFFVTFFLSLIPVIGAAPVAIALGVHLFFQGEVGRGGVMIGVAIFTGSIDNILRSLLMSKGKSMPATISFICLIGAIIVFGFYGIFFGPFLSSLAARFLTQRINDGTQLAN